MSAINDFLDAVLPQSGPYCAVGISNAGKIRHYFVESKDKVVEKAEALTAKGINAYFAVASFKEGTSSRTQENSAQMKAFWLDLDCGDEKGYASQDEALSALPEFIRKVNLPEPLIVNSGNGVHVYWPLHEEIDSEVWRRIARKLKAACRLFGLEADPAVTSDSARILRVPTTANFKDPSNPKTVCVIGDKYEVTTAEDIEENLDALDLPKERATTRPDVELSATAKALLGARTTKFSKIARRSVKGTGCNAISHIIQNQDGVDEPLWRAGLSIAWACEDADTAIHKMSRKHSGYTPESTIEKAKLTKGPYTCATIDDLLPGICDNCPHKGKISSPIQLGNEVKRDEDGLFMLDVPAEPEPTPESSPEPSPEPSPESGLEVEVLDADEKVKGFKPPFPYFRAKDGGVYREDGTGDEATEIKVYEYDLYPFKRIMDPNDGESVVFRHHLPRDGMREFTVPLTELMSTDQFRSAFGREGVVAPPSQMKELMNYSIRFAKELQKLQKAQEARLQFGWDDKREKFIVGNRAYCSGGATEHNPASSTTADLMRHFEPKGNLDDWRAAVNVFAREGMEAQQLVVGAGFASPLMAFTGVAGAAINLISGKSGTGKSSAGLLALGIYGCPDTTAMMQGDTYLAKLHRMGVMSSMPVMTDEVTNIKADELSNLLYAVSQGRARHRMEKDSNRERKNITSWRTIFLTNSNASLKSKLAYAKARPDGEMMRLLEIQVPEVPVKGADVLIDKCKYNHYGRAAEIYIPWVVENIDKLPEIYDKERDRIYARVGKHSAERFWVSMIAMILVGLRIAQKLGLHDYDLVYLEDWVCNFLLTQRDEVKAESVLADDLVGEFLMDHSNGILAIGPSINPRSGDNIWMPARSSKLVARFELEENLMYIAKKPFREYCVQRQFMESEALKEASREGSSFRYVKTTKKRMMAGTAITSPGVDAHVFQCAPEEADAIFDALDKRANEPEDKED